MDFSELKSLSAIYTSGVDSHGRPIVVFILEKVPGKFHESLVIEHDSILFDFENGF
jgi:hypothetical protein